MAKTKTIGDRIPKIRNSKARVNVKLALTRLGRIFKMRKYKA